MAWMVIRVRGGIHARHDIVQTLEDLHLTRPNHLTILPEVDSVRGMLTKVQGYVTWGEAEPATVQLLLQERGESSMGTRLNASNGSGPDVAALARSVASEGLLHQRGVRPILRLRAPKGGWRSTKKPFTLGGALGYRGRSINDLAKRML